MSSSHTSPSPSGGGAALPSVGPDARKRRVSYFYEPSIGDYYYGQGHPMKPHRIRMAHNLVVHYSLHRLMEILRPFPASAADIRRFHSDDYVHFLSSVAPSLLLPLSDDTRRANRRFNVGEDCPVFDGLFEFCQASAGGSVGAAVKLNRGDADIAINWAGGLHHAKKCEASGFCYVNDIVLGILELLKFHKDLKIAREVCPDINMTHQDVDIASNWAGGLQHTKKCKVSGFCYIIDIMLGILGLRKFYKILELIGLVDFIMLRRARNNIVLRDTRAPQVPQADSVNGQRVLYVDIDVHHGDGVEEAFYTTDRVMTVSFHKYGDFFPGTGHIKDVGFGQGKHYALNVPLNDGMDDDTFAGLFKPIIQKVMEVYQPDAVVLQCGADSLSGDRLGCFNLSVKGHAECLQFIRSFNVPLMVLGGGGYTIRNVARCWCYETAVAVGVEPDNKLPYNEYYEYFGPDYTLHVEPLAMENKNSSKDLEKMRNVLLEQLSTIEHVPSVQFQERPPNTEPPEEEDENMDQKPQSQLWNGECYDSEPEDIKPDYQESVMDDSSTVNSNMRASNDI